MNYKYRNVYTCCYQYDVKKWMVHHKLKRFSIWQYYDSKINKVLLNLFPFSHKENELPFIKFGLNNMEKNCISAIIITDNGKGIETAKKF